MSRSDLKGKTFSDLTVLSREQLCFGKKPRTYWWCKCTCGKFTLVLQDNLVSGKTISCGCAKQTHRIYEKASYTISAVNSKTMLYEDEKGLTFLFSPQDEAFVKSGVWQRNLGGVIGYLHGESGKLYRFVRLLFSPPEGKVIDHINGNKFDNRRENLRICSQRENCFNKRGVAGVCKYKNKWAAAIQIDKVKHHLGYFDTKEEALSARLAAEKKYFGEFAPSRSLTSGGNESMAGLGSS